MGLMLIALYLAMYFGEYDEHLLTYGIPRVDENGIPCVILKGSAEAI